jgi:hypothetical protein
MSRSRIAAFVCGALAVGMSSLALAYPTGATVSTGTNPIRSAAGVMALGSGTTASDIIAAPTDQDLVITDLWLGLVSNNSSTFCDSFIQLVGSDGQSYGAFSMRMTQLSSNTKSGLVDFHSSSGLLIPAGVSLSLSFQDRYCSSLSHFELPYTISGYLAQP